MVGQSGDAEDEVQLRERLGFLDGVRIGLEVVVGHQEGGPVDDGEQRSPFLEEDVDALVGEHVRRRAQGALAQLRRDGGSAVGEEGGGVDVGARLPALLQPAFKGILRAGKQQGPRALPLGFLTYRRKPRSRFP